MSGLIYLFDYVYAYFKTLFDKAGLLGWAGLGILGIVYIAFPVFMTWNVLVFTSGIFTGLILIPKDKIKV